MSIYGTRPEVIKLAPLIAALHDDPRTEPVVVVTGQHSDLAARANSEYRIVPEWDLAIFQPGQSLSQITALCLLGLEPVLAKENPDLVVVQGDTASCLAGALAAVHAGIPVAHLEAGMRSGDRSAPFPEEAYRRAVGQLAGLHLVASAECRRHLLGEGIDPDTIALVGSTAVDALLACGTVAGSPDTRWPDGWSGDRRYVLITCHRRESLGQPMADVARAVAILAERYPEVCFLLPAHPNPLVREVLLPPLRGLANVVITEPLGSRPFTALLRGAHLLLTDSGGVQVEASSAQTPVLVLRDSTEYQEMVRAGGARLVGTDPKVIVREVARLLEDDNARAAMRIGYSPYGDGSAAVRSVAAIIEFIRTGKTTVPDFRPMPGVGLSR